MKLKEYSVKAFARSYKMSSKLFAFVLFASVFVAVESFLFYESNLKLLSDFVLWIEVKTCHICQHIRHTLKQLCKYYNVSNVLVS